MKFGQIDIPEEHIVAETASTFVFVNLRPFLKYHLLVSPIQPAISLRDMSEVQTADLFNTARICMKAFEFYAKDFTMTLQDGEAAGQTVPHVHIHLIPRLPDDLEVNNDIYRKGALECNYDGGRDRPNRSYDEMAQEALYLKKKFYTYFL
ncbi:Diadenosine polyphosphate hydrolase, proteins of the histidine triad (HIT) family [Trachipleistophora hominis]|uniref:Diadenosine polyphosphate hydrolase, proteins of the histidine triad (HIT) family n=1 Tax=Trachipleistophora hominis TaxID=72359 RepID=L7JUS9_TRAHO|nr:Diadenosine polyphosphate hydrolase, proteins of the histidine triad (HIT) family [Trachipleistophora hominis]